MQAWVPQMNSYSHAILANVFIDLVVDKMKSILHKIFKEKKKLPLGLKASLQ